MNLHQTEQNNSKSSAVANNIGNQNNSEQGISLMPPEIIFSEENIHEPANELFQLKEDDRKEIPNFLQVWNKEQAIQQKTKKEPENFVQIMNREQKEKLQLKKDDIPWEYKIVENKNGSVSVILTKSNDNDNTVTFKYESGLNDNELTELFGDNYSTLLNENNEINTSDFNDTNYYGNLIIQIEKALNMDGTTLYANCSGTVQNLLEKGIIDTDTQLSGQYPDYYEQFMFDNYTINKDHKMGDLLSYIESDGSQNVFDHVAILLLKNKEKGNQIFEKKAGLEPYNIGWETEIKGSRVPYAINPDRTYNTEDIYRRPKEELGYKLVVESELEKEKNKYDKSKLIEELLQKIKGL